MVHIGKTIYIEFWYLSIDHYTLESADISHVLINRSAGLFFICMLIQLYTYNYTYM